MLCKRFIGLLLTFAFISAAPALADSTYQVAAEKSRIEVEVFRGGLLKAFGHDHLVAAQNFTGQVRFDPERMAESSVTLVIEAASLTVLDTGEPEEDRREVQATMLSDRVLDVATYPQIIFRSTAVDAIRQDGLDREFTLAGILTLHGVERPIAVPVRMRLDNAGLHGQGEISLRQSDFGIRPITVAGGLVRVRDQVRISFDLTATANGL